MAKSSKPPVCHLHTRNPNHHRSRPKIDLFQPKSPATVDTETRQLLAQNETSADDALSIYFSQGVVPVGEDAQHIALIWAYDPQAYRGPFFEVDHVCPLMARGKAEPAALCISNNSLRTPAGRAKLA